jgi:hypothetical protein
MEWTKNKIQCWACGGGGGEMNIKVRQEQVVVCTYQYLATIQGMRLKVTYLLKVVSLTVPFSLILLAFHVYLY